MDKAKDMLKMILVSINRRKGDVNYSNHGKEKQITARKEDSPMKFICIKITVIFH